jgi:hypothetical protein
VPVVAVVLLAAALEGQSLAEAARREQERRQAQSEKKPAPSFTDADLPDSGPDAPTAEASPEPPADPEAEKKGLPDDETDRKLLERTWRARFAEARAKLRTAESRAFVEKVGVAWKDGMIPYQTIIREPVETAELVSARKELASLEEEFRRTGLPPGWGRE